MVWRRAFLLLCLLFVFESLSALDPYLSVELTEDLSVHGIAMMKHSSDNLGSSPHDYEIIQEEAVKQLLIEARWILSGMIYGFSFHYVPGSKVLQVEDLFELEPLFLIPEGDERLKVEQVLGDYTTLTVLFVYWLDEYQKKRVYQYGGNRYSPAGGRGSVEIVVPGARLLSMKEAVKQALREDLRIQYYSRPRETSGFLTFSHSPLIRIGSGSYSSFVRILYLLEELEFYPVR